MTIRLKRLAVVRALAQATWITFASTAWSSVQAATQPSAGPAVQAPSSAASAAGDAVSEAERLLFLHPHLAATRAPQTLAYAYAAEAASAPRATDQATLALKPRADGACCSAHAEYLSGEMAVQLPDFDDATANPILLYFLEGEVRLMQRTTKGQSAHFRRQIRQALATDATVADTTIRWNGKQVPAHTIRVAPFLDDPYRSRFEHEATTEYVFVLSDAVPGGVAGVTATLPGAGAGDPPQARRRLTLEDPQPATPSRP